MQGIRICDCFSIATGRGGLAGHFRQAEVEYLGVAAPRYEDISRFDVAMHDAFAVSRVCNLLPIVRPDWADINVRPKGEAGARILIAGMN